MTAVARLFPADSVDKLNAPSEGFHSPGDWWGDFSAAVHRWETLIGRAAPAPVEIGPRGGRRLAAVFGEWLMGLPGGWITRVQGLNRSAQLKAVGNGAMSQQAFTAYLHLMHHDEEKR
ncbi:hypothetical protein ACFV6D_01705 [Kitasatospora sp. NPDC059812]|uniref:hypothetical protein n=1 Tax=Kitasatospora sp. NPDC059812 TaxID=3346958 RepID=UPI003657CF01